jgi:hypothetical protein
MSFTPLIGNDIHHKSESLIPIILGNKPLNFYFDEQALD